MDDPYEVVVPSTVAREIKKLMGTDRTAVFQALSKLSGNPRPSGSIKMKVKDLGEYRIRVGSFRVRYDVDDEKREVHVLAVKSRDRAYGT